MDRLTKGRAALTHRLAEPVVTGENARLEYRYLGIFRGVLTGTLTPATFVGTWQEPLGQGEFGLRLKEDRAEAEGEWVGTDKKLHRLELVPHHNPKSGRALRALLTAAILVLIAFPVSVLGLSAVSNVYEDRGLQALERASQDPAHLTQAIRLFGRAVRAKPSNATAHYNLAIAYETALRVGRAEELYLKALGLDSAFYPAYNNLARLYLLGGDPDSALKLLNRALEVLEPERSASVNIQREEVTILKNRGWARLELGALESAERDLTVALERSEAIGDKLAAPHCLLAQLYEKLRNERALAEWELCLRYNSQDESIEDAWLTTAQDRLLGKP